MSSNKQSRESDNNELFNDESPVTDLERAQESININSEHRENSSFRALRGRNIWSRFKESFVLFSTIITSAVAIGGLLFTIYQFDKTMKAQRHATAEAAVGQFIAQVTELRTQENLTRASASKVAADTDRPGDTIVGSSQPSPQSGCTDRNTQSHSLLDGFIVSRAQMLIDGEETGQFAGDILRFLTANQYGHYIGRKPCPPNQQAGPRVSIEGLVLVKSKIADTNVKGVFLKCLGFDHGIFDSVAFTEGKFQHIVLNQSLLLSVDFSNSWLSSIKFTDTEIGGHMVFNNSTLFGVDFTGSRIKSGLFEFNGARIIKSNLSGIELNLSDDEVKNDKEAQKAAADDFHNALAKQLSNAESLWGSVLHDSVSSKMKQMMAEEDYEKLVYTPPASFEGLEVPAFDWQWDSYCPPKQRRDRRLNEAPENSLSLVQAIF